jgi:hypothetical protein
MKNSKNKRTLILLAVLVVLLAVAYKVVLFPSPPDDFESFAGAPGDMSGNSSEALLREVESINFNTAIIQDERFKSLKSIEVPLISLPVGRKNPFSRPNSN